MLLSRTAGEGPGAVTAVVNAADNATVNAAAAAVNNALILETVCQSCGEAFLNSVAAAALSLAELTLLPKAECCCNVGATQRCQVRQMACTAAHLCPSSSLSNCINVELSQHAHLEFQFVHDLNGNLLA